MTTVQVVRSILEVSPDDWAPLEPPDFPFSHYHFLHALETSDCLGRRTGWEPRYVLARESGRLLGALILFAKSNSYGEYIFDWAWADAFARLGLNYYPKLVSAIPFTPATGPKLLLHPAASAGTAEMLLRAIEDLARSLPASSTHLLFVPECELARLKAAGYFVRHSYQFHWVNGNYSSFNDFTARLRSKRRKEIARERAQVAAADVRIKRLTGRDLTSKLGTLFYHFYLSTIDKRQSFDYLTAEFFQKVFRTMADKLLLVLALNPAGEPVAGALNYLGRRTLYGRNWGCLEEYRALHFELCYYQGIEFAIARGLARFEAGAQGEHKFPRGFLPTLTYSAHQVANPALRRAIEGFVAREKRELVDLLREYEAHSPYHE